MKKYLLVMAVFSLIFTFACGGGGNDPKAVMSDYLDAFEGYINGLTNVNSADDLVKVTEEVNAKFEKLLKKFPQHLFSRKLLAKWNDPSPKIINFQIM